MVLHLQPPMSQHHPFWRPHLPTSSPGGWGTASLVRNRKPQLCHPRDIPALSSLAGWETLGGEEAVRPWTEHDRFFVLISPFPVAAVTDLEGDPAEITV